MKSGVIMRSLVASLGLLLGASQLSCSVNDYCLNCGHLDGGNGSGSNDANDGGGSGTDASIDAACVPTGPESCDGKDNDCNGLIDDGTLPGVDDLCANQMGACAGGRMICDQGALKCDPAKSPKPESCNGIDDNCNGAIDEGDPGGGAKCGTEAGTCVAGTERCTNGSVQCIGFQDHTGDTETCNGQDDDCDNIIDEGIGSLGACGPVSKDGIGICKAGTLQCMGGVPTCTGAVFPQFEVCNHLDDDCSGAFPGDTSGVDDTFNTQTDPNNCGDCVGTGFTGVKCLPASDTCINSTNNGATCTTVANCTGSDPNKACVANSSPRCATGQCTVSCNAGFVNLNGTLSDGCEYRCTKTSNVDDCDGIDNDCDGMIDEDATAPAGLCKSGGACGIPGPTATCTGASGWVCNYTNMTCQHGTTGANTGAVCTSSATCTNGGTCVLAPVEFPEVSCDGIDNNCDGNIDESHQPDSAGNVKGTACNDGEPGVCLDTGTWQCDTTSPATEKGNLICQYTTSNPNLPRTGIEEDCNAKDDDCDGTVDEQIKTFHTCTGGTNDGTVCTTNAACTGGGICTTHGEDWVDIGGGKSMMQFEASRPDADAANVGLAGTIACSRQTVQPWTNITYPEAQTMCQALKYCSGGSNNGITCAGASDCPSGTCVAAHLCSEEDWHHTCASVAFPASTTTSVSNTGSFIEAEDFTSSTTGTVPAAAESGTQCASGNAVDDDGDGLINDGCPASGTAESGANCTDSNDNDGDGFINDGCPTNTAKARAWSEDYLTLPGNATTFGTWTGISDMQANANTGASMLTGTQAAAQGPSMSYSLNFTATGTYHVWLRMYAPKTADDMVYVGMASPPTATATAPSLTQWGWVDTSTTFVISGTVPQAKTLTIWMGDDGARVDRIFVGTSATAPTDAAVSHGNTWAYSSPANPNVYGADVCNGDDHDTNAAVAGDQDDILATGTLSSTTCAATQNSNLVYDMSGNVKEWVLAHAPGENPIRGGASNSSSTGLTCALNFTLADNAFLLPNIGFRCCR